MQKTEFKVKIDGEDKGFTVRLPSGKLRKEAREYRQLVFKKKMFEVDENGKNTAVLASKAYNTLKEMGVWTDEKEARVVELAKLIDEKLHLLSKGKSEQVPNALKLREIIIKEVKPMRSEQFELLGQSKQLDSVTVESIADEAEIDYLVSKSTFNDDLSPTFTSLEDLYSKVDEEYAKEARTQLQILIGMFNPNWFSDLPENKLLKKHNFIDEKGNYIIDGKLVNSDGKPINDKGQLVNENGEAVNDYGDLVNEEGDIIGAADFD